MEPSARALLDAVIDIAADLRQPTVLQRVVEHVRALTGADHAVAAVHDPGERLIEVVQSGKPAEYRTTADLPAGPGTLSLPIVVDGEPFARLCASAKPGGFTGTDEQVFAELAHTAAVAVRNARTYDHALQRERWRDASHQVTAALLVGEDSGTTLRLIAERARDVARASAGAVALPSESEPGTLVFDVLASPDAEYQWLAGATVPAEGTATGVAYTSGQPVVVREYGGHVVAQQAGTNRTLPTTIKDLDSAIAAPLIVGSETLGVLLVARFHDKVPFTDAEVELVRDFAMHAALAVEFARAEGDRRRLAVFEDRDRIARDLHDLVIQRLFAIGLGLEGLSRTSDDPVLSDKVTGFVRDLDRTIRDVRNSIFSLQEPAEAHGVRSDLLRLAQDSAPLLGFEPRVSFDGPLDAAVRGPVRSDLIASVREALSNVARHADASSAAIEVTVDRSGRQLTLSVIDDGVGLPDELPGGAGLVNLRRRAERWHGTLSVRPRTVGGTKLQWTAALEGQP
ncbi:GAF domain-containing protein [Amycolatopsis sp. K13G38]|uniref:GAF domain-containing protein n=1 Tax=Amycolatopsis acididurans TaxID=2724524 RepID=A0ABX1IX91_9PSEU|nr:GAF domain-containing protein [Amycolatopsis acididurans]NKQ52093.1 GAF domain-containing protein [Amycolatopsis acididurans]